MGSGGSHSSDNWLITPSPQIPGVGSVVGVGGTSVGVGVGVGVGTSVGVGVGVAVAVKGIKVSKGVKAVIEKAGGSVT